MAKILFRMGISAAMLVLLFYIVRDDIPLILTSLKNINRRLAAASLAIFLLSVSILAKRLQIIFRSKETNISFAECLNLTLIGYFFNNFLPTSVGGDIVKAMCASRITKNAVKSVTSVLMDRIFGLFTFILIPGVTLVFFMKEIGNRMVPVVVYGLLGSSIICFFMIFNRNVAKNFKFLEHFLNRFGVGEKFRQIYEGLHDFKYHRYAMVAAMALSLVSQGISILVIFLLGKALGSNAEPVYYFLLVPVVHLVSMIPSLNGLGIREGAYIYFLSPYTGREIAAALGILWLGLLILLSVVGGLIYLIRHDYHIRFKEAVLTEEASS